MTAELLRPLPQPSGQRAAEGPADRELLEQIAGGQPRALEQLYGRYNRRLLAFLCRVSSQREPMEEAINDTFWIIWRKAGEFRGSSQVSTWIMGIAWRCAMKALRRNASRAEAMPSTAPAGFVVEPTVAAEQDDWLRCGLNTLPLEQRATLELAYFAGHSCEEIAAIMDCPVNTVKTRMFQARIKLRNLLPQLGGTPPTRQREGAPSC